MFATGLFWCSVAYRTILFIYFSHPIYYPRTTLVLPTSINSDPGSHSGLFLPLPHYGTRLLKFFREKNSSFASLVDSRRTIAESQPQERYSTTKAVCLL